MPATVKSLGRETPLSLRILAVAPDHLKLAVAFADGVEVFEGDSQRVESVLGLDLTLETLAAMPGSGPIVLGGASLSSYSQELQKSDETAAPEGEIFRALLPLSETTLLSLSDDESVRLWAVEKDGQLTLARQWPVGCTPLFARGEGKNVTCVERGRLQDRDSQTGTILRTWKHEGQVVSAFADPDGNAAVTVDGQGQASYWDLHSREQLFTLLTDFPVTHGALAQGGSRGVLTGADGELAVFRVVDGGAVEPLERELPPLVDLAYAGDTLLGLDENGGLWSLNESPSRIGGCWAGWSTAGLCQGDRVLVGTASGEILSYPLEGGEITSIKPHSDAILALLEVGGDLLSLGADSRLFRFPQGKLCDGQEIASFLGESVVSCALSRDQSRLWVALEEGRLCGLDPVSGEQVGEHTFSEHRLEEIQVGVQADQLLVVTDKGSLKLVTLS